MIYDMHSSLPQQLSNFNFSRSRIVHRIFDWQERRALSRADAVITICPDLAEYATGIMPDPERHILIENSIFDPVRMSVDKRASGVPAPAVPGLDKDGIWVVYAGTLESYQGIDLLIRAFPEVLRAVPRARLLVAGGTPQQVAEFSRMAQEEGLADRCVFTGRVAPEAVGEFMRQAALTVSPRNAGTNTPLKIYQQMASGVPLVATRILSHTQVLDEQLAILVEPDSADLARGIVLGLDDRAEALRRAANSQKRYAEYYSREAYVAKMQRLLANLLPPDGKLGLADG